HLLLKLLKFSYALDADTGAVAMKAKVKEPAAKAHTSCGGRQPAAGRPLIHRAGSLPLIHFLDSLFPLTICPDPFRSIPFSFFPQTLDPKPNSTASCLWNGM